MANDTINRINDRLDALEQRTSTNLFDRGTENGELPSISDNQISSALTRLLVRGDALDQITNSVRNNLLNTTTRSDVVNPLIDSILGDGASSGAGNSLRTSIGQISANLLDAVLRAQRLR